MALPEVKKNVYYEEWVTSLPNLTKKVVAITGTTSGTVSFVSCFYELITMLSGSSGLLGSCGGHQETCRRHIAIESPI